MKRVFTEAKKANRGPSKTAGGLITMSIIERRVNNILSSDSKEYDRTHGVAFTNAVKARKAAKEKRQNIRRTI